eukprot:superscaffoldBa00007694_g22755
MSIIQIPPHHYIHVLDQNTNIAHVEIGPLTYILQDDESYSQDVTPLQIVELDTELEDFKAEERQKRVAEDEWLFEGPGTHTLRKEVTVPKTIKVCKGGGKNGAAVKIAGVVGLSGAASAAVGGAGAAVGGATGATWRQTVYKNTAVQSAVRIRPSCQPPAHRS